GGQRARHRGQRLQRGRHGRARCRPHRHRRPGRGDRARRARAGDGLRERARPVRRSDRVVPVDPVRAQHRADRGRRRAAPGPAGRVVEGPPCAVHPRGGPGEAVRERGCEPRRVRMPAGVRGLRLHARVRYRAVLSRCAGNDDLRGDERGAAHGHREIADRGMSRIVRPGPAGPAPAEPQSKQRKRRFSTLSDLPIAPLYTADDLPGFDPERDLGRPGEFPYTRGVYPSMYRGRLWTMRQFAGFGSAEDTNARFHYLLAHGVTGLSTAFDMPTLMGRDADDPLSRGEVGREGVAVSSLADMRILFDRIPLDEVTTSMTINGPASLVWAMYLAAAAERGIPFAKLGGTIQHDRLKEYG